MRKIDYVDTKVRKITLLGSLIFAIYVKFELPQSYGMHFFYYLKVAKITWYSTSYLLTFSLDPYYMMHL